MKTLRIILADDQLLVRAGVRALLESLPGHEVIAECADGNQAIAEVRRQKPDITVLDIAMPGPSGIEVTKAIRQFDPATRILILSSIDRHEIIEQAMAAGANGYLLKDFLLAELQLAVQTVSKNGCFLSPRVQETLNHRLPDGDHAGSTVLTVRQTEILRLVASGKTTKEIARDLQISPKTVEFHRAQLMERIGVHDVTGLTRYAMQYGLIT
ncbi:response regulator [Dechloromonas hortensis]|uniref:response regulator n=1 Tax=Dechloromonas hortensis TaxID=337779 RepID=UPI001291ACD7|nr:response regulator transcription factor [Dechloromonas hortensis]